MSGRTTPARDTVRGFVVAGQVSIGHGREGEIDLSPATAKAWRLLWLAIERGVRKIVLERLGALLRLRKMCLGRMSRRRRNRERRLRDGPGILGVPSDQ